VPLTAICPSLIDLVGAGKDRLRHGELVTGQVPDRNARALRLSMPVLATDRPTA
jgi:hypothetical protein